MNPIEAVDVCKTYAVKDASLRPRDRGHSASAREVHALRGVSLEVQAGEVFALLGPNGAGKSTMVRILATLTHADSGTVRICGTDISVNPSEVRRQLGYVGQASGVDMMASGRENLRVQGHLYQLARRRIDDRVEQLFELFGLLEVADRRAATYSGGMRRRLDLALALVHQPRVLLLDEPTTGLDPEVRVELWQEIRRLTERDGLSVLLTTHYLDEADHLARRVAILDQGAIVAAGTPEKLKDGVGGDTVSIELGRDASIDHAVAVLNAVEHSGRVLDDGTTVHTRVANGARALPGLLAALDTAGIPVSQATVSRPSLDDVYLAATGHRYRSGAVATPASQGVPA